MPSVLLPSGVRKAKPYGGSPLAYVFCRGLCQMNHTKKSHPVVGLIILIVLGYLVYHVAYLAIQ
jgi:hypothetical protein